ncbi:MAG TPA: 16S rRNA (uracil(1498)-N(3))-methyltransferase [Acidimicrobiia bacterium]|nr:16S rRNA (uracil(1498)-N(3))-methyltransferase [Acidimicrobiia bacterium]
MKHIPHLVVGAPWPDEELRLSPVQWRHLTKVLRKNRGDSVTYTDGLGTRGLGRLANQSVVRGDEVEVPRPSNLTVAVAPPSNKDRQRFLVEKLAEIGVARLVWIETNHGKERVASPSKVFGWVLAAVEQSQGSWLMETSPDLVTIGQLEGAVVICHPGGAADPGSPDVIVVGPEGGFGDGEIPLDAATWDLGPNILRVETAAVVAAARVLG